jgi:cysteine desulfurase/selenocysteine lyase
VSTAAAVAPRYDVARVRADFPILARPMRGRPLAYLDSASSAQKPRCVIESVAGVWEKHYANVHRGVYELSETSTRLYDEARTRIARLLGAGDDREVVFVRNTSEGINLVASSWGRSSVAAGDEILVTEMEHHSNIVPWQLLCEATGARLRVAPVDDRGALVMEELEKLVGARTRLVAVAHVSNVLGTINPVREIAEIAHRAGALVLLDGAQAAPRLPVDVATLGCDFYVFSGHKLYGPGIGAVWGRLELLEAMPPYQGGGGMISSVSFEKTLYAPPPLRFEAGTPDVASAVGLGAAIDYVTSLGMEAIAHHEAELLAHGTGLLGEIPGLRLIGTAAEKTGVLSFVLDEVHPHDVGTILDQEGVAIRAGHHCAQPLMERFGVPATARASVGIYNDHDDLDRLAAGIRKALEIFA